MKNLTKILTYIYIFFSLLFSIFIFYCDTNILTESSTPINTESIQVTDDNTVKYDPAWSPDGSQISFSMDQPYTVIERYPIDNFYISQEDFCVINDHIGGAALSPSGEKLAYVSITRKHIWIYSLIDSSEFLLTPEDEKAGGPKWSPDGKYIAFGSSETYLDYSLWIVPSGGGKTTMVAFKEDYAFIDHSWSPCSKYLAFRAYSWEEENNKLWTVNIETHEIQELSSDPDFDFVRLSWSPDSSKIVFVSDYGDSIFSGIWIFSLKNNEIYRLGNHEGADFPRWSPDGTKLVFYSVFYHGFVVCTSDGIFINTLATSPFPKYRLSFWTPDSKSVLIHSGDEFYNKGISLLFLDHLEILTLTMSEQYEYDLNPTWHSNQTKIIFERYYGNLYCISTDDKQIIDLPTTSSHAFNPEISPDGKYIAFDDHRDIFIQSISDKTSINMSLHLDYSLEDPTWSPDGKQLVCTSSKGLKIFKIDDSSLIEIAAIEGDFQSPSWSRNHTLFGSHIAAYKRDYDFSIPLNCIYIIDHKELDSNRILIDGTDPCWSPDGTTIAYIDNHGQICTKQIFFELSE